MNTTDSFPPVFVGTTTFPLRSDAKARGLVPCLNEQNKNPVLLLDGPPYANGLPHLGHVLNKHLKDAVARALSQKGMKVDWRPGWDCHGLPLELAVEKKGADRKDRLGFVAAAREFAHSQVQGQAEVFQDQGWQANWDNPWKTMDPEMEAGTLRRLAELLDRGVLDVRQATVPWCPHCQSTLSMAEQEEKEVETQTWVAPFELEDGSYLLSWTTTPWTLPLHQMLVVSPQDRYVALRKDGRVAWVSEQTAHKWAQVLDAEMESGSRDGSEFVGMGYRTPWTQNKVRGDSRVLAGAGTGVLHAVPGLAALDTELGQDLGEKAKQFLNVYGRVENSPCPEQNGVRAGMAMEAVEQAYDSWPFRAELEMSLETAHCWRHKKPLLTRPSRQVFMKLTEEMRAKVSHWVETMEFTPEAGRARLRAAVNGRPDWCLSRQRTWGVPMALYLDEKTQQPHARAGQWMRKVADAMEVEGVEAWWSSPDTRWVGECEGLVRMDDVLDVWFDSGCVPALLGHSEVVVEGVDQFRGWFQSCLWVGAALGWDDPPFKRVVAHGFVVDEHGRKLSKSTGGDKKSKGPAWKELPTDVVRAWALSGSEGAEKSWSQSTVRDAQAVVARWRGLLRFLRSNTLEQPQEGQMEPWDQYWAWMCQENAEKVVEFCAVGATGEAMKLASRFADTFSAVAVGSWKDRLYCAGPNTKERQAMDWVVRVCLAQWVRMLGVLAPRMVYELLGHGSWENPECVNEPDEKSMEEVRRVLQVRQELAGKAEELAKQKVGPTRRRVYWDQAPAWTGQLVADALDVGQVVFGELMMEESTDPVCPRCRRVQPAWVGSCCQVCQKRCSLSQNC